MKRFLTTAIILGMILCAAGCTNGNTQEESSKTSTSTVETSSTEKSEQSEESVDDSVNEGEFKTGAYAGNSTYAEGEFSMTWNYVITFNEDGTFVLTDDKKEEKGKGTYTLTDNRYTMTYSDERSCTFVVQQDGTLKVTSDLPYGQSSISPEMVGGIVLDYSGEASVETAPEESSADKENSDAENYSIKTGTYSASYTKESAMAGTVVYNYSASVNEDGTFSYSVSFDMGGTMYDGSNASGTYTVDSNKFTFTDSEGNITEGKLTADNTLVISLKASKMAKEPYEVTFTQAT